jgi:AraC-like DNA-binding protein
MILLERLLQGLDITVHPFAVCRVGAGRHIDLGSGETAAIHYLLRGAGTVSLAGHRDIVLSAGHAVIVPAATRHGFVSAGAGGEEGMASEVLELDAAVVEGESVVVCGTLHATYRTGRGLFDYLSDPIVVDGMKDPIFAAAFESLLDEMVHPKPGSETLVRALMQQCLVVILRRYCESGECRVPWLVALEDERLAKTVEVMIDDPRAPHTVERLAALAGMSRSTFAEHFRAAFGRAPIEFLKEVRLRRAAGLLTAGDEPIKTIGTAVGYDSRSYFTRAFTDVFGVSPAAYREASR